MAEPSSRAKDQNNRITDFGVNPTRRFSIQQREPWSLPEYPVELPGPGPQPGQPPSLNLLTTILPPVILIAGTLSVSLFSQSTNWTLIIPMVMMSVGFPLANLIGYASQTKKYQRTLDERKENYIAALAKERKKINDLIQVQRQTLEQEYPTLDKASRIAVYASERLWWRRPTDNDFLTLRLGKGISKLSFEVQPPKNGDPSDPLIALSANLLKECHSASDMPLLLDLAKTGSVALASKDTEAVYQLTRRLLVDLLVHHSPQDVQVALLSDHRSAVARWEWLKWAPHTAAILPDERPHRLNFQPEQIEEYLKWLVEEANARLADEKNISARRKSPRKSLVVLLDDTGIARQTPEIARLAECGHEIGIYILFIGGQSWPRECRARIDLSGSQQFLLTETWDVGAKDTRLSGEYEPATLDACDRISHALAGLEVVGNQAAVKLPESIRLSQVLGNDVLELNSICQRWTQDLSPRDLLQFPIGVKSGRENLEPMILNLKPEDYGGFQAFHTVLIGTTGSGKSVFLQSMIVAAAYNYSPRILNFLLMDFKAGASELSKLKELPHVVGMVTDLSPELAGRALIALDSEIQRRKRIFDEAGKISDIWAYNRRFPETPLPHLVLVLDEFAKGIEILPDLQRVLQTLATQGRALGMYLMLANQKVTSAVDSLLANIGWRIVLRVSEKEEMRLVDASLPRTERPGRGYIRVKEQVTEFQGSRSDQTVQKSTTQTVKEFNILEVLPDGRQQIFYTHLDADVHAQEDDAPKTSELDALIALMKDAQQELHIEPARRIYLDPLPGKIELSELIDDSAVHSTEIRDSAVKDTLLDDNLLVPLGYLDKPEECVQEILAINFNQKDGHLWIAGAPGSGKSMTVTTLLLSLAQTHTPDQAQIYILEFGSGALRQLEALPHVGSVIRLQQKEKVQRLLNFLDKEFEKRTSHETQFTEIGVKAPPAIFVVINNYAEMRANYPDEADRISRFVRDGKSAGIHLIITTNRGPELSRMVSSNIARRLVLQLASRDEYLDVVGKSVQPLSLAAEGRGYWIDDAIFECQVAAEPSDLKVRMKEIAHAWTGNRPHKIDVIPSCVSQSTLLERLKQKRHPAGQPIPVGIAYENLELVAPDVFKELPSWLILGPRQSGKSNLLACIARSVLSTPARDWTVCGFSLRRSPLADLAKNLPGFDYSGGVKPVAQKFQELTKAISSASEDDQHFTLLLIDDLGAFFEMGSEEATGALNALIPVIATRRDVYLMAAGLMDEMRMQLSSPVIKLLKQSHTGFVLSKDTSDMDWLGAQISLEQRKLDYPVGRGFFVSKGRPVLIQTPCINEPTKPDEK